MAEWTSWDLALLKAYQFIQDYTDSDSGQLIWVDQSPDIDWSTKSSVSNSQSAIQKARDKRKDGQLRPGERLVAVPKLREGKEWPTLLGWLEREEKATLTPDSAPEGARPPTPLELKEMRDRRAAKMKEG